MARTFVTRYLRIEKNGTYKYRRRVPEWLQTALGKTELVKTLGKSQDEALIAYAVYHKHAERLLSSTRPEGDATRLVELKDRIVAEFLEQGLDPFSEGVSDSELLSRSEAADRILAKYPFDPETGQPDPKDLTLTDNARVTALLQGVRSIHPELTVMEAFSFYLSEKNEPDPYKRKKQEQRIGRAQRELLRVTQKDIPLSDVTRAHARKVRDSLTDRMAVSSVKRNINDLKAVFSLAIREHDLSIANPFSQLEYKKPKDAAVDLRHPLPPQIIKSMYVELENDQVMLDIWTLMHHSGAQNAEILGLSRADLELDGPVPYFKIQPQGLRTVKKRSRIRSVPLVGLALEVARRLASEKLPEEPLFPGFSATKDHDRFSQLVRKRLRKHTTNKKHTIYSLRHTMKDALRRANVGERVEHAILGHSNEKSASAQYGSAVSLEEMHSAMTKVHFDIPTRMACSSAD